MIEDAYSGGEIMTKAELYMFWDVLFSSCYNTAESPDSFKLGEKRLVVPMVKNWLTHPTPVVDLGYVIMVVVAFEHVCNILRKPMPMHQLLHSGSSHRSKHALHCSSCPLRSCLGRSPTTVHHQGQARNFHPPP